MINEQFRRQRIIEIFIHLKHCLEGILSVEESFGDCVALGYQAAQDRGCYTVSALIESAYIWVSHSNVPHDRKVPTYQEQVLPLIRDPIATC